MYKLHDAFIRTRTEPASYEDANGLFFEITEDGRRLWIQVLEVNGDEERREIGTYPEMGLRKARDASTNLQVTETIAKLNSPQIRSRKATEH